MLGLRESYSKFLHYAIPSFPKKKVIMLLLFVRCIDYSQKYYKVLDFDIVEQ